MNITNINMIEAVRMTPRLNGKRLNEWMERFLSVPKASLTEWHGTWTEVTTAKVIEIYRRRGVFDELALRPNRVLNAVARCLNHPELIRR